MIDRAAVSVFQDLFLSIHYRIINLAALNISLSSAGRSNATESPAQLNTFSYSSWWDILVDVGQNGWIVYDHKVPFSVSLRAYEAEMILYLFVEKAKFRVKLICFSNLKDLELLELN